MFLTFQRKKSIGEEQLGHCQAVVEASHERQNIPPCLVSHTGLFPEIHARALEQNQYPLPTFHELTKTQQKN